MLNEYWSTDIFCTIITKSFMSLADHRMHACHSPRLAPPSCTPVTHRAWPRPRARLSLTALGPALMHAATAAVEHVEMMLREVDVDDGGGATRRQQDDLLADRRRLDVACSDAHGDVNN